MLVSLLHVLRAAANGVEAHSKPVVSTITFSVGPAVTMPTQPMSVFADAVHTVLDQAVRRRKVPGMSFGAYGFDGQFHLEVSTGKVSADKTARDLRASDGFSYGSGTKMATMAGVMQLVDAGTIELDDAAYIHIDPLLQRANGTTLAVLFGEQSYIQDVTVRHLLAMRSGIQDVDVGLSGIIFDCVFEAGEVATPFDKLHRMNKTFLYVPGSNQFSTYSSSNYLLLGLLLANKAGASSWNTFDYRTVLGPPGVQKTMPGIFFPTEGSLANYTDVNGYMCEVLGELKNHTCNIIDVRHLDATQGSFGYGHMVASPPDFAHFAYNLYGPTKGPFADLATAQRLRGEMLNFRAEELETGIPYGLGTMYEGDILGTGAEFGLSPTISYGHGGQAYGMSSLTAYVPGLQTAMSWAIPNERESEFLLLVITACETVKAIFAAAGLKTSSSMCWKVPWNNTIAHGMLHRNRRVGVTELPQVLQVPFHDVFV
jgi:CubicO group peptidase (beta-lactamase class C family)